MFDIEEIIAPHLSCLDAPVIQEDPEGPRPADIRDLQIVRTADPEYFQNLIKQAFPSIKDQS